MPSRVLVAGSKKRPRCHPVDKPRDDTDSIKLSLTLIFKERSGKVVFIIGFHIHSNIVNKMEQITTLQPDKLTAFIEKP